MLTFNLSAPTLVQGIGNTVTRENEPVSERRKLNHTTSMDVLFWAVSVAPNPLWRHDFGREKT
jgi:hypothetical protein